MNEMLTILNFQKPIYPESIKVIETMILKKHTKCDSIIFWGNASIKLSIDRFNISLNFYSFRKGQTNTIGYVIIFIFFNNSIVIVNYIVIIFVWNGIFNNIPWPDLFTLSTNYIIINTII